MKESAPRFHHSAMLPSLAHGQTLYDCLYQALALGRSAAGVHVAFPVVELLDGA